ncbi:MAG: transporter, partial [Nostocoides sp.]
MSIRRLYRNGKVTEDDRDPVDLVRQLSSDDDGAYAWIDLSKGDDRDALDALADVLDLHDLAVEDAVDGQERQKLFRFPGHRLMQVLY